MNALNENGLDAVLSSENLRAAYRKVKSNRGTSGVDGIGVDELKIHLRKHWPTVESKLRSGDYRPALVRVVQIPKPGGGQRELSIPTTQDRMIQQALVNVLSEAFEPTFHVHSYGYRPGRSAHDAVRQMKHHVVEEGRNWVVDIDIKGFFDHVDHDILMREVGKVVKNIEVKQLIGRYLRGGKLGGDNRKIRTSKGVPQGGPLSPLLSNVYLNVLDHELAGRGIAFVRYADDITIYAKSERAAERLYERVSAWIVKHLKLEVNTEKSGPRRPDEGSFLGFRLAGEGRLALSAKSLKHHKAKVRGLLDARRPWKWSELVDAWNEYIRGWTNYFRLSEWYDLEDLSKWIRRHLRKLCWQRWHNRHGRLNAFKRLGVPRHQQNIAKCSRGAWRMAKHPTVHRAIPNRRITEWGFHLPVDLVGAVK